MDANRTEEERGVAEGALLVPSPCTDRVAWDEHGVTEVRPSAATPRLAMAFVTHVVPSCYAPHPSVRDTAASLGIVAALRITVDLETRALPDKVIPAEALRLTHGRRVDVTLTSSVTIDDNRAAPR